MKTSIFALPVPLSLLLFLSGHTLTSAYPTPYPAPKPNANPIPIPIPIPSDPTLLESYLDFNHECSSSTSSPLLSLTIPPSSLQKRHLPPPQQEPLISHDELAGKPTSDTGCVTPEIRSGEMKGILAVLTSSMLRDHPNGIAFPYSATTHSSTSVELSSSIPLPSVNFSASLELSLAPGAKGSHGIKPSHFAALLERVSRSVDDETEGGVLGSKSVFSEGVSGAVSFKARWVVYDMGNGRVCAA